MLQKLLRVVSFVVASSTALALASCKLFLLTAFPSIDNTPAGPSQSAYIYILGASNVLAQKIDYSTGLPSLVSSFPVTSPNDLAADPLGRFIFVSSSSAKSISVFSINHSTGGLTLVNTTGTGTIQPGYIRCAPTGNLLFCFDGYAGVFYSFSISSTGSLTQTGTASGSVSGSMASIAFHPTLQCFYESGGGTTGDVTPVTYDSSGNLTLGTLQNPASYLNAVGVSPSGKYLYTGVGMSPFGIYQYTVNSTDGSLSNLTTASTASSIYCGGMVFDSSGSHLYVSSTSTNLIYLFLVDSTTGALTQVGSTPGGAEPWYLKIEPSGRYLYAIANGLGNTLSCFSISQADGTLSLIGSPDQGMALIDFAIVAR